MEEGEVVLGFAVASGGDAAAGFEPGVGAFDWPAVAGKRVGGFGVAFSAAPALPGRGVVGDRFAGSAAFADLGLDAAVEELVAERLGVVAAVGPQLAGSDALLEQLVDQR